MTNSRDSVTRLYVYFVFAPIVLLMVAGVLAPLVQGLFFLLAMILAIGLVIALAFHEEISRGVGTIDPLQNAPQSGYLSVVTIIAAIVLYSLMLKPEKTGSWFLYPYPYHEEAGIVAGSRDVALQASRFKFDFGAIISALWVAILPVVSLALFYRYLERHKIVTKVI